MRVSVAICTYNGENYLREQLDSILSQTVQPDEVVICDDGSTDQTLSIIEEFQSRYPSIINIFQNLTNLKVIKNFEKAINLCNGDIIFLSDQDDIWFPYKIETVLNHFQKKPQCKAFFHDLKLMKEDSELQQTIWDVLLFKNVFNNISLNSKFVEYLLKYNNVVTGAALAFKKEVKNDILPLDSGLIHDYQIAIKLAIKNSISAIPETLGYYRLHKGQQIGIDNNKVDINKKESILEFFTGITDWYIELQFLSIALNRAENYESFIPGLSKYVYILKNNSKEAKKNFFKNTPFFKKKRILLRWYKYKILNTTIKDILLK
ncbi:glycosyltransferase [Apibacter sp. HY039]|uniref:glycosyltransferase n=1 Tax=Apibacter sp. HY039 TaxID=2501476 RepID=UPI000FEC1EF2|nr:glycosyltransferase [Apibacter sp. HY039]